MEAVEAASAEAVEVVEVVAVLLFTAVFEAAEGPSGVSEGEEGERDAERDSSMMRVCVGVCGWVSGCVRLGCACCFLTVFDYVLPPCVMLYINILKVTDPSFSPLPHVSSG